MRNKYLGIFALIALLVAAVAAGQQSGKGLLEQGRARKTAGDLQGAVEAFEKVLADFGASDRNSAANALLELGAVADSLGQLGRARSHYERVRNDFKDQTAEVDVASSRLKAQAAQQTEAARPGGGSSPSPGASKVVIRTPYTDDVYGFALSPDGRTLVFQGTSPEGKRQLWRQVVDASAKPEPIAGTEGAGASAFPFFSPDGKSVVFYSRQKLWQIDLAGGVAKELADAASSWGGAWRGDAIVVSSGKVGGPLDLIQGGRVSAASPSGNLVGPQFIDDRRFLYFSRDNRGTGTIEIASLDSAQATTPRGLPAAQAARYTSGHLLYVTTTGILNAMRLEPKDFTTGPSFVVAQSVGIERRYPGYAALSASASGAIAYREKAVVNRQMMWMNRSGDLVGMVGAADSASPGKPRISPDGKVVLYFRQMGSPLGSVWVIDAETGAQRQIQDGANVAIWSPAGDRMILAALRGGGANGGALGPLMIERPVVAAGSAQVGPTNGQAYPEDWASNGTILFRSGNASRAGGGDLFAMTQGQGAPVAIAETQAAERNARFSPDGKWIAYQSDEGGRDEIYVQPFPGTTRQRQRVSLNGGASPQWGRKGRELYFISADNRLMATPAVDGTGNDKAPLEFQTPKPLFKSPLPPGAEFDTAQDGDRFLILAPIEETPPIVVLSNWLPAAR